VRYTPKPLALPPGLPDGFIALLPGRGEVFYRHHRGDPSLPTLLLLHGWTASADLQWFTAYEQLAERYSFIAIDHRGHGRGLRTDVPFLLEDVAEDAAALIEQLGVGPVVTVGYSMGGPLSLLLAREHPELVAGLVLEATSLEWRASSWDRLSWRGLFLMEVFLRSRAARWLGRVAVRRLANYNPEIEPYLAWIQAEARRGDPAALVDAGRALALYDARTFATAIHRPSAVVITTRDHAVKVAKQRALADAIDAERFELEGDHFSFWSHGKEFSEVTRRAVDDVVKRLAAIRARG
jgi:pimeloyl-ACP methyl ester carboxylesterase